MVYKQVKDKVTGEVTLTEPAWSGNVKSETDIVMRAESKKANNGGTDFYVRVESSKVASVPTGREKLIGNIDTEGNVNVIGFKTLLAKGKTLV
jgi:hypothetical protein